MSRDIITVVSVLSRSILPMDGDVFVLALVIASRILYFNISPVCGFSKSNEDIIKYFFYHNFILPFFIWQMQACISSHGLRTISIFHKVTHAVFFGILSVPKSKNCEALHEFSSQAVKMFRSMDVTEIKQQDNSRLVIKHARAGRPCASDLRKLSFCFQQIQKNE